MEIKLDNDMRLSTFFIFLEYIKYCDKNNLQIYKSGFCRYSGLFPYTCFKIFKIIEKLGILKRNNIKSRCKYFMITSYGRNIINAIYNKEVNIKCMNQKID
jgi:predicted transcriptional regulator